MIKAFRSALSRSGLVRPGDRILVAVSGGSDSVALMHLLLAVAGPLDLKIAVAHYNHRLRGRESVRDARFVEKLASSAGVPFSGGAADSLSVKGSSLQEEARRQRLSFLLRTAGRRSCRAVALGHTMDDQAETMLMRFLIEGGPAALGGIPASSHEGRIIHPLLGMRKADLRSWLRERGEAWREDRSNESCAYVRNRIRLQVMPLLRSTCNVRLDDRLAELASQFRRDNDLLETLARELLGKVRRFQGTSHFPAGLLADAHGAVLSRALLMEIRALAPSGTDVTARHLSGVLGLAPGGGYSSVDLSGGVTVGRDRRGIHIFGPHAAAPPRDSFRVALSVPGTARFHHGASRVTSWVRRRTASFAPASVHRSPWRCALDADSVSRPLTVRRRAPGDRVRLLAAPGTRKVKTSMIDAGIPRLARDLIPVVCDASGIVWIAGLRPAHRCRITSGTKRILYLDARGDFCVDF